MIIPSKNVDALYNAMLFMVRNESARAQMAENAREMIRSRFERGFVRQCLYDYYDEILKQYERR